VSRSFNKIAYLKKKRGYLPPFKTPENYVGGKYTPTALALLNYITASNIDIDRWMLAQADCIRIQYFTLYHCFGESAQKRYEDWEKRQERKFIRTEDKKAVTNSLERNLRNRVSKGHVEALKWSDRLIELQTPSLAEALWYLYPQVQSWYLLCYPEFRELVEAGIIDNPRIQDQLKRFNRSSVIQGACLEALMIAITEHGPLKWNDYEN